MSSLQNLITDVEGLAVGHADDPDLLSGVTVILPEKIAITAVDVRGGGPGSRETDALCSSSVAEHVHGLVLSGGSAFGLNAATGVQSWLAERGRGFPVSDVVVPIVPQAIIFDLLNGGNKAWGITPPYDALARNACDSATNGVFPIGSHGAGLGATTATLRGGLGSASARLADGSTVGAIVVVNALGSATISDGPHFWAAPFERDGEFGNLGPAPQRLSSSTQPQMKGGPLQNTTIAVVATDVTLRRPQARRFAIMAQTGLARALHPVHTPLDGDIVFAMSTGTRELADPTTALAVLGSAAADTLARAIARAVYEAAPAPRNYQGPPSYKERFGTHAA